MNPVLLVTGGSRGIGAATALLAAERGFAVAVNYAHNSLAADEVVRQIRANGGQAMAVQADVGVEAQVVAMFKRVDAKLGPLTALVNNAGVVDVARRVDEVTTDRLRRLFDINVLGSFLCAREAILRMSTRHGGAGGSIVNVSSVAARLGGAGQYVDYAATKGAMDTFTIGLAQEVATKAFALTPCAPASLTPTFTPRVVNQTAPGAWRHRCPCAGLAPPRRSRSPSCGCCRTRRATPQAP